ncbi:unnamed protein product [Rhizophagus irregularis]|nr:unnamed protein product [Rhizophagus irregularis]
MSVQVIMLRFVITKLLLQHHFQMTGGILMIFGLKRRNRNVNKDKGLYIYWQRIIEECGGKRKNNQPQTKKKPFENYGFLMRFLCANSLKYGVLSTYDQTKGKW